MQSGCAGLQRAQCNCPHLTWAVRHLHWPGGQSEQPSTYNCSSRPACAVSFTCMLLPAACSYRQMAGRAGRAGIDTCGECILVNQEIPPAAGERLFTAGAAPLASCLVAEKKGEGGPSWGRVVRRHNVVNAHAKCIRECPTRVRASTPSPSCVPPRRCSLVPALPQA